jgi:hypothetical protein
VKSFRELHEVLRGGSGSVVREQSGIESSGAVEDQGRERAVRRCSRFRFVPGLCIAHNVLGVVQRQRAAVDAQESN